MKKSILLSIFLSSLFLPQQHMFSMEKFVGTFFAIKNSLKDLIANNFFLGHNIIIIPTTDLIYTTNIFDAIKNNEVLLVKRLIKKYKNKLLERDKKGNTPLHYAASFARDEIVFLLLKNGAPANAKAIFGVTPLHYAVGRKLIVGKGEGSYDKDINWGYENSPFCAIIRKRQEKIVALLITYGAHTNKVDELDGTPLHTAVRYGRKKMIELLINYYRVNVNAKDKDGNNPICTAVKHEKKEMIELLIKYGANVNGKNNKGNTPLYNAVLRGRRWIIELLFKHGANINAKNNEGNTILHTVVHNGDVIMIRPLIEYGADINAKNNKGNTPLCSAILHCITHNCIGYYWLPPTCINIPERLIECGADINAKNHEGQTPLYLAIYLATKEKALACKIIKLLVEEGHNININAEDICGCTPLNIALSRGMQDIADYLISKGAQTNIKNIFYAVITNDIKRVEALVKRNKSVVNQTAKYRPPIAPAPSKKTEGWTPLHLAALHGHVYLVECLIENDAPVNIKTDKGCTPLSLAVYKRDNRRMKPNEYRELVNRGLNPHEDQFFEHEPFKSYKKIVQLLLKHGAHFDFEPGYYWHNAFQYLTFAKKFYNSKNKLHFVEKIGKSRNKKERAFIIEMVFLTSVKKIMEQRKEAEKTLFGAFYNKIKSSLHKPSFQALKESLDVEISTSKCSVQKYIKKAMKKNDLCINKKGFNEHTMQMNLLYSQENEEFTDLIIY
ncbi:ankyrin repeat domain-containing protein [Candidatus Dependentiae bacterium]